MKTRTALALLLSLALGACAKQDEPLVAAVDRGSAPGDPLGDALHRYVLERAGRLEEVGAMRRGRIGGPQTEEAIVLLGGYCYAVLAEAEESAGELGLRLLDDRGEPINVDRERGARASLGLDEQLCTERAMQVRIQISGERPGDYAMRIFRATAL